MFSALLKAFTGRAGFLSSLLALLLIAITSAAVLLSLPRIEQGLENSGQSVLADSLSQGDILVSFRAEGRNLLLEGQFEDVTGLSAKLKEIEGVRNVVINGLSSSPGITVDSAPEQPAELASDIITGVSTDNAEQDMGTEQAADLSVAAPDSETDAEVAVSVSEDAASPESAEVVVAPVEPVALEKGFTLSGEPLAQLAPEPPVNDEKAAEDETQDGRFDQSSLSLRYDGTQLHLSGHLADEQMAQLIAERVANVIPAYSVLQINLDGKGKGSPLNWMSEFLRTVSGLPDDAQGLIEGSDQEGVKIIPDVEQTLVVRDEAPPVFLPESESTSDTDAPADSIAVSSDAGAVTELEAAQNQSETAYAAGAGEPGRDTDEPGSVEMGISGAPVVVQPAEYITELNSRIAGRVLFESGRHKINDMLAAELDGLAEMMRQNPDLLLRVVGNIDFSIDPRFAEFVGIDRAREIKKYLYRQRVEPYRILAAPLPKDRAYDKRVQLVFYISE